MSTTTAIGPRGRGPIPFAVDCEVMIRRNLVTLIRTPQMVLAAVFQPLMFVLTFSYVFGDALGGDRYREFLIGGIMAQTVVFNFGFTAIGLNADLNSGMAERFRALPMSRLGMVVGRTTSDVVINVIGLTVMSLAGLAVGWRISDGALFAIGSYATALVFGYALSWVAVIIGVLSATATAAQSTLSIIVFPLCFVSSAFIPSRLLPGPLEVIASWNPVSAVARSFRQGFGNPISVNPLVGEPATWASHHAQAYTLICSAVIVAVMVPVTARLLRRAATR
ncbi:MAG: ABC transporter permease [Corynebacteriales bacterium]|uniref:Transport permease protein n=1 Tax=Williamsia herbipolensis TaxID=1603258 RepID=A0AAU4K6N8_9NOCA|nr:ABC transporter permease [Williamsia herbipolensis]MCX6469603.1 ABC transporter permease [Mycobacteriales bacterium]